MDKELKFDFTPEQANRYALNASDADTIGKIMNRARDQFAAYKRATRRNDLVEADWVQLSMDLINAHRTRQINLMRLLLSDEASFLHDLAMIHVHMDRLTCRLPDGIMLLHAQNNPGVISH